MAFLELIFLMILTGYIFFRLWDVLGTRTGHEKPPRPSAFDQDDSDDQDNVIVLRGRQKEGPKFDIVIDQDDPFKETVDKIRNVESDFDLYTFKENAKIAFEMTIKAFVEKDLETLKQFLDTAVYKQFEGAIVKRDRDKQTLSNTIVGTVEVEVVDVTCRGNNAEVSLRFKSQQRYITYDALGAILDNVEEVAIPMVDVWTFKRTLGSDDPTWLLSGTKSEGA